LNFPDFSLFVSIHMLLQYLTSVNKAKCTFTHFYTCFCLRLSVLQGSCNNPNHSQLTHTKTKCKKTKPQTRPCIPANYIVEMLYTYPRVIECRDGNVTGTVVMEFPPSEREINSNTDVDLADKKSDLPCRTRYSNSHEKPQEVSS
jgi:hypothetical protein